MSMFPMAETHCSRCRARPCVCRIATTTCACGVVLVAADDLESKRRRHEEHMRSGEHRRGLAREA